MTYSVTFAILGIPPSVWGGGGSGSWRGLGGAINTGYIQSLPSLQGETELARKTKLPTMGQTPTMPYQFTPKEYVDRGIHFLQGAVPSDSPSSGTIRVYRSGSTYKIYAFFDDGNWKSATLT